MSVIPRLYTPRLCLRPFASADAARVRELAGDKRVAATTALIPHPYPEGAAEAWISTHESAATKGREWTWAITLMGTRTPGREEALGETGYLIGSIGIRHEDEAADDRGTLGYWIGVPYWNKGFATEAVGAVLKYCFGRGLFQTIGAHHMASNVASGQVLQKLGMTCEGTLPQHVSKWGERHDVVCYALSHDQWMRLNKPRKMTSRPAMQPA